MRAGALDIAINDLLHFMSIKRLADIIVCPEPQSFLRSFKRTKTGEHDNREIRVDLTDLTQTVDSAHSRHPNVHDDGVGLFFFEEFEAGLDAIGGVDLIIWFQEHAQAFVRPHFVINNKDLGQFGRGGHKSAAAKKSKGMPARGGKKKKKTGQINWGRPAEVETENKGDHT